MRTALFQRALVALLVFCLYVPLHGQIGGGSIVGNVSDPSGAAVAGAQVVAKNTGTNENREAITNESGYYEFPLLPPGRYVLEGTANGFQKALSAEFTLNAGTRPRIDLEMKIGQIAETVEVVATAPLVNATTTDLGVVVDRSKVDALPLNGRNFQQLVGLQAGVVNSPSSAAGGRGGIEFHGSSALANNLMLDGVDMSFGEVNGSASDTSAGGGGALINTVSVEAIEEFKATGNAFSAEYGRSAGGVLNVITRAGTNDFHGTLFEFFRNDKLDANNFFSNRSGLAKPALRWNQFGGNLGGPILKDRLFFFFNYEGARVTRNTQVTGNTYTPALLAAVPSSIRDVLQSTMPSTYEPTSNPLIGLHRRNDPRRNREDTFLWRGDLNLGAHRLSGRYSYNNQDFFVPNLQPTLARVFPTRFHNAVLQDSWTISPTMFNEVRAGVNRVNLFRNEPGREAVPAWVQVLDVSLNDTLPSFINFTTTTYTLADNFTVVHGRQTIKAGFEIREVRSVRGQGGQPTHVYNNLPDLMADRANRIGILFGGGKGLRTRNYGFYVQDDIRLSPRLQLNVGVRYEYYPPLRGGFNVASSDPFGAFNGVQEPMFAADRNNWGPRVGLVWDPTGHQKWVIRAGGGIGYVPPQPIYYYDMAFIDPKLPFVTNFTPADVPANFRSFPLSMSFVNEVAANPALLPASLVLARQIADYNIRDTYAGQWNFSIQRAITNSLVVQGAYVGSRTLHLLAPRNVNLVDPATGRRPRPEFGDVMFFEDSARISYHALQLSANQRLWKGLTFDAYYTWAKAMAYGAADGTITFSDTTMQDFNNLAGSYGPKQGDIRHRFTGVYSFLIPSGSLAKSGWTKQMFGGWTFQGILNWRSGLPLNVTSGRDFVGSGRTDGQRPDLRLGVAPYIRDESALTWLNLAAFDNATPTAQRRYGNLGFNALRGPSAFTYDAGLHKTFFITERHRLTFRAEAFNILNHKVLGNPNTVVTNPNFGRILTASDGRNVQLALKYQF
ncbi:MAG TPA: TonB-dependent receptor [Bryobacteraceae bacterium]|jgi:outer membrane receptor protein involved in Fe transport|nr:TonB-dependent receptor [Bryobacteraceae bacterium]